MNAQAFIAKVADWSHRDPRVIASCVCGSHARGVAGPDSDIDFCIVTGNPASLLDDRSWINSLGADARVAGAVEDYKLVQSVRVYYGQMEVEFGITDEAWMRIPIDHQTAGVMNSGLKILFDPDQRLAEAARYAATMRR